MIKTYSKRLSPPYSGQMQIVESERARAVTMDCEIWEIHFIHAYSGGNTVDDKSPRRVFKRVAMMKHSDLENILQRTSTENEKVDERILELVSHLVNARIPFPAQDIYEYWLLDYLDESPLALIFTCTDADQMPTFPNHPVWTALQGAVMPICATEDEQQRSELPVNYRLEQLVAERAGKKPRARWFKRREHEPDTFPTFLVREDWEEEYQQDLCQRYLDRQAPRLLMLHGLEQEDRKRLEIAAKPNVLEVERFYPLYPEVVDEKLMNAMRVEARLRGTTDKQHPVSRRRDGIPFL